ncbi:protocadherin Fat 4 [Cyclopterus lumpus]|uniref:protocadherin Fat 4 n=1 Tax=Cyclopterus lumpus TaxID=8103 RepID=UPI001486EE1C|nr:protocadherin Fat 4 [Cyclopterus lumpus]
MDPGGLIPAGLFLALYACVCVVAGSPVGDVELVGGITSGVKLVSFIFPEHLQYLELSFTPGEASATVRTKKPLDADSLAYSDSTLYYSLMCDGLIKYNNTRTLKILDVNNKSPIFSQESYSADVSETQTVESEVIRVSAVDGDSTPANNRVIYSMAPASEDFALNNVGAFILKRPLNYNIAQKYNFIVTATDPMGLSATATVQINVVDFDNLNPYFSHNSYRAFIPENQVGSFRTIEPEVIKAQDGDTGINMTLTYSISADKYRSNFNMDSSSGVVSLLTALDREESSLISVNIKVAQTDNSLKTADAVVSVTVEDVNDNPPQFDQPGYYVTLRENSPLGDAVLKASVTDRDQAGFVGTLRILPESSPFSIDSDGTVRVKDSSALDREATDGFTFQIEAREADIPNAVKEVEVNVTLLDENDNSPAFTSNAYKGKVFANQTVGMQLVQVKADDPDAGENGQVKYSLDFGNNEGFFSIDENSGDITLLKIIPLLQDEISQFPLYITARDGGTVSRSSSTQVNILAPGDSNPQFLHTVYRGTLEEEQDPGVVIVRVDFLPLAAEVPVTLRVDTEADKFVISNTGELSTKVKLDYDEAPHNYSVAISITDGVNSNSAVVEVGVTDVNDNSPVFTPSSVIKSVPEDAEVGSNVTVVPATDKDSNFNKELRYSLRGGGGRFSADPVSGMVSVAGALDRETKAEYTLLVVAEDQGRPSRSATASLLVRVSDINDNVPEFSEAEYQVEVLETDLAGTILRTLSAVDPDEEANGRVTYSIFQQSPSSDPPVFELDSSSGTLRLARPLDYSQVRVYSLKVQASDGGTPSLVGNGSVVVKVKDVNNNPPEFSEEIYHVAVTENLASGASILTLKVTDRDEGGFSDGYFLFTNDTFDINKDGVVSLRADATLDRETKDRYELQVVAVDRHPGGLSSTAQLNVTVLDYNDNAPQLPGIPDPLRIPEGDYSEASPGDVFTFVPTDADLGANGEVTLSLLPPHPLFRFREDGTLQAVGPLDRERRETYELVMKASDKGRPQRETVTSVTVSLEDLNDNRPQFSSGSFVGSVLLKDAEDGKLLLTLSAADRDAGNNSLIAYSFCEGGSPYLALNSETGAVTLTSDLAEVTEDTTLVLTAMARDHGRPPLNSTARVVVNLRVVSLLEGVAFRSSSYNFSVPENRPPGASVGGVWASSGSVLYDVAYALKTHADRFSVNASGAVLATRPLDKEEQEWYILDVEAVDTRTPPTSATAMVRVQVEDVNESPSFLHEGYKTSVVSIAPFKTTVAQVKASDPDVGHAGQLVYGLAADSAHFDVDPSSGRLYVVSVAALAGQVVTLQVTASDPGGLHAATNVQVEVQGASAVDVVLISLNQPANVVEKKVLQLENSLGAALGWTVTVIEVSNGGSSEARAPRAVAKTTVGFIAEDRGDVVSSEEVTAKLQSQSAAVRAELVNVFGEGLQFEVELKPQSPASSQAAVIALGTMLALSMLGLMVAVGFIVRFHRKQKPQDSDKESFNIDRPAEGLSRWSQDDLNTFKQGGGAVDERTGGAVGFKQTEDSDTSPL